MIFRYLSFLLGLSCNKKCSYCFRNNYDKPKIPFKPSILFKNWVKNNSIKFSRSVFVGGEPLLYINSIKELNECLPSYMPKIVITNGTLLTENIITYFNNNNFWVIISHDGKLTKKLRGYDILDDKIELILKIKNLGFQSVISKYNINILDNYDYIFKKVHRKDFYYSLNFYMDTGLEDIFTKDFDYKLLRKYLVDFYLRNVQPENLPLSKVRSEDNRDGLLGTSLLLNGDVVNFSTLKKYGTVFDNEDDLLKSIMLDRSPCNCYYNNFCNLKRQIKTEHLCKMYKANIQAINYIESR